MLFGVLLTKSSLIISVVCVECNTIGGAIGAPSYTAQYWVSGSHNCIKVRFILNSLLITQSFQLPDSTIVSGALPGNPDPLVDCDQCQASAANHRCWILDTHNLHPSPLSDECPCNIVPVILDTQTLHLAP